MKNTPQKTSVRNKKDIGVREGVEFVNLVDREVIFPPNKRATTVGPITFTTVITRSASHSSDGRRSQQSIEIGATRPVLTEEIVTKKTEETKNELKYTPESREKEFRPVVHTGFDHRLYDKVPPG